MNRFILFFCVVLCLALAGSGCDLLSPGAGPVTPQLEDQPSEPTEEKVDDAQYEIVYMDNPEANKTDVYIQNLETKAMEFFATIPDVREQHYHSSEYHNGNVYLIRRLGDTETDNWRDELWKYDELRAGTMVYFIKGLDFRVSPDESYVAVSGGDQISGEKLVMLDKQGSVLQEFSADQVLTGPEDMPLMIGLLDWSDDSRVLWVETDGPAIASFSSLASPSWQVSMFDLTGVSIGRAENALNPNTGKVVFSDLPMFFAVDQQDEFIASGETVTLFVYDLASQSLQEIAISTAKEFDPLWLDAATIEYNDPVGEGRITAVVQ